QDGTQCSTGGDDRPRGPERAAGAEGPRRRERLEEGQPDRDAALVGEDLLHRLGNPVPADGPRAVAGHDADHQSPQGRHEDDPRPEPFRRRSEHLEGQRSAEEEVGHQSDESLEGLRDSGGQRPTPTASVQIHAVRRVTLAACGAMWAEASPGPSDGATGRPSVVDPVLADFSATASGPGPGWRTAATPTGAGLALEEH